MEQPQDPLPPRRSKKVAEVSALFAWTFVWRTQSRSDAFAKTRLLNELHDALKKFSAGAD
jgi:hypothetical protein